MELLSERLTTTYEDVTSPTRLVPIQFQAVNGTLQFLTGQENHA